MILFKEISFLTHLGIGQLIEPNYENSPHFEQVIELFY